MFRFSILLILIAVSVSAYAQSSTPRPDVLIGSWRLISIEDHASDGSITYNYGREPLGLVMFGADGRLSLHLMRPDRREWDSGDFLRPTPDELSESMLGYFGYFGTYTADEASGTVTFHVEGAAYPNYIGTDQRRFYSIEGNRLTLRTPPERAGGKDITYFVIWEREN